MTTLGEGGLPTVLSLRNKPFIVLLLPGLTGGPGGGGITEIRPLLPVGASCPSSLCKLAQYRIFLLVSLVLIATGESESKGCIVPILFLRTRLHKLSMSLINIMKSNCLKAVPSSQLDILTSSLDGFPKYFGKSTLGIWKVQELCETETFPLVHCESSR